MTDIKPINRDTGLAMQPNRLTAQQIKEKSAQYFEKQKNARYENKQAQEAARQLESQRANSGQCPKCGSDKLQGVYSTNNKGFSDSNACGGCCLFGPIGLLCGLCGSGKKKEQSYRMCLNCGNKF